MVPFGISDLAFLERNAQRLIQLYYFLNFFENFEIIKRNFKY